VFGFKRAVKNILFGPLVPQAAWARLHRLALQGMNIGSGSDLADSGEMWVLDRLARHLRSISAPVVFDVGANVGDYAAAVRERLGSAVRLHCFEPSEKTFVELERRLGGRSGVSLHNVGLSDAPGEAVLYASPSAEQSGMSSMYDRDLSHLGLKLGTEETIQLTTIDRFCRENGVERAHFVKLDCEGHELKVLAGGREMLERGAIDFVQFEFGGCNLDSRTYLKDFFRVFSPRFRILRILRRGVEPVDRYREQDEIFTTTNFIAARSEVASALA
jgi:FkbM family methyltransferase